MYMHIMWLKQIEFFCFLISYQECQLDLTTAAYAFVYFEKLILKVTLVQSLVRIFCQEFVWPNCLNGVV